MAFCGEYGLIMKFEKEKDRVNCLYLCSLDLVAIPCNRAYNNKLERKGMRESERSEDYSYDDNLSLLHCCKPDH